MAWRRETRFAFGGDRYEQDERFYVVRTGLFEPRATALTELEQRATTGPRWWRLGELASTAEILHPAGLAGLVKNWLEQGPPPEPLLIG